MTFPSSSFDSFDLLCDQSLVVDSEVTPDVPGADLVPPSPILSPSQIAFSWSCGSIPVCLYDEAYASGDVDTEFVSNWKRASRASMSFEASPYEGDDSRASDGESANCDTDDWTEGGGRFLGAGLEPADDCKTVLESADSGTGSGSGPFTPRREDISKRMSGAASSPGIVSQAATHPVKSSRISMQTASGGLQHVKEDLLTQESDFGLRDTSTASVARPTTKPNDLGDNLRESSLRSHPRNSLNLNNQLEVSRWSADSDSVFLSGSTSTLAGSVSAHRLKSVNPSIVIDSGQSSEPLNAEKLIEDDDNDESAFQTPTKASLRPAVSWISSRSWDYGKYEAYVAREEPSRHALISNSLEPYVDSQTGPHLNVTPPNKRTTLGKRDINVLDIDTPRAGRGGAYAAAAPVAAGLGRDRDHHPHGAAKEGTVTRTGSLRRHSPRPAVRIHAPETFDDSWLADVCVQFLIDQEGFRAAEPKFRYTGTSRVRVSHAHGFRGAAGAPASSADLVQMAQFRMVKRESYHFHHAPFETPPILRRVTVNGDETHDYVSRQALLTLKANGVYVLHGQEALVSGHGHGHGYNEDATKLHWKLEYLVDDRVIDVSRRIMDGEKVLTLLSFSCSPALLLPSQAKKNTLIHVFKKSVAPKLVAEKVQPPGMGASVGGMGVSSGHNVRNNSGTATHPVVAGTSKSAAVSQDHSHPPDILPSSQTHAHISHPRAKTYGWGGLHRRVQSHNVRWGTARGDLAQKVVAQEQTGIGHRISPSQGCVQFPASLSPDFQHVKGGRIDSKQRRNSSVEEWTPLGESIVVNAPFNMISSSRHHWEAAEPLPLDSVNASATRYILPPEQLTKLLDSIAVSDSVTQVKSEKEYWSRNANGKPPAETLSPRLLGKRVVQS